MKRSKLTLLATGVLASASLFLAAEINTPKQLLLQKSIVSLLNRHHYNKPEINDEFSKKSYKLYLERLDYYKRYFYDSDIERFSYYEDKIDDQVLENKFEFYMFATELFETRVIETRDLVYDLLDENNFDLSKKESLETDPEKLTFPGNYNEKKAYWKKILKWDIANRYLDLIEEDQAKDLSDDEKDAIEYEYYNNGKIDKEKKNEAIEKVTKKYKRIFRDLSELSQDEKLSLYLNSFLNVYDPHTTWMPPISKEEFDLDMTGKLEGIGANLTEENGYTKVTAIVPGSPSWKQKELETDDIILKVAQGNAEPVDIVEMSLKKVVKLIRGKKGSEVRLTVKKPTGEITIIPIIRDIVVIEESYAKAATIENNGKKYGYIQLPKFYRDFKNRNARNSTGDVKDAILAMERDDLSGIVLDLRNNGGGALTDAVDLSGLFFDKGPVVQVRDPNNKVRVLEDEDSKTYFDKPLVVLVNSLSASASEILAGALQDYNRAVIIGSNQTFGKGTVQTLYDLNNILRYYSPQSKEKYGSVKFTIQKFYRVNGESTQFEGVKPNIVVPDSYDYRDIGEREYDNALPWDTINETSYKPWQVGAVVDSNELVTVEKRIKADDRFNEIRENNERLKIKVKEKNFDIQLSDIISERKQAKKEGAKLRKKFKENEDLKLTQVDYHPNDLNLSEDERKTKKEKQDDWFKAIRRDIYINEAMNVISDLSK